MPKLPRLTAADAEGMLLKAGFVSNATLHPKIVKQVFEAIEETSIQAIPPE